MYIAMIENLSLYQFVEKRSQQQTPSGRLLANSTREACDMIWSYVAVMEEEYPNTMTDDEQLMLACFILLAEGQELPV